MARGQQVGQRGQAGQCGQKAAGRPAWPEGSRWASVAWPCPRSSECVARHNAGPQVPPSLAGYWWLAGRLLPARPSSSSSCWYCTYCCSRLTPLSHARRLPISLIALIPNPVQLKVIYMTICLETAPAEATQKIRTYKESTDQIHAGCPVAGARSRPPHTPLSPPGLVLGSVCGAPRPVNRQREGVRTRPGPWCGRRGREEAYTARLATARPI